MSPRRSLLHFKELLLYCSLQRILSWLIVTQRVDFFFQSELTYVHYEKLDAHLDISVTLVSCCENNCVTLFCFYHAAGRPCTACPTVR